jgi:hypothetical protein
MGDEVASLSQLDWPDWILTVGPEIPSALASIGDVCERLRLNVKDGYVSEQVFQRQLTDFGDDQIDKGVMDPKGAWLQAASLPRSVAIAQLYNNGSPGRILKVLCFVKKAALVQLVDMTRVSLQSGSLLVALSCLRSVIEHVAHMAHVITELRPYSVSPSFDEANKTLWDINGKLLKMAYGTRVDWEAMLLGEAEGLLKQGKVKYKPNAARADVTAEQVLNAIDALSKEVKGTRGVYEVLCEFAHPNIGVMFGLTRSVGPFEDAHGCVWVRKELSLLPPVGAARNLGPVLGRILATTADCLNAFERSLVEAGQEEEILLKLSQAVVQRLLLKNRDLLDPYAPCPCASGSKVKFCCGASKINS